MIYFQLFLSFLQVGLFSIGGGYAAIPLIQNQVVGVHQWLTLKEFTDLITISGMTPGPIAINSATFVGLQIAGPLGAILATTACILPSIGIVSTLAYIYYRYQNISALQSILGCLRPAVVSLIATAGLSILSLVVFENNPISISNVDWLGVLLFAIALLILRKFKANPILIMSICGLIYLVAGILPIP
ncbi:MAG: chromate transporter [Clostridiales bacterium]|nr:chromate transporter [Clostridiales bacterium]